MLVIEPLGLMRAVKVVVAVRMVVAVVLIGVHRGAKNPCEGPGGERLIIEPLRLTRAVEGVVAVRLVVAVVLIGVVGAPETLLRGQEVRADRRPAGDDESR